MILGSMESNLENTNVSDKFNFWAAIQVLQYMYIKHKNTYNNNAYDHMSLVLKVPKRWRGKWLSSQPHESLGWSFSVSISIFYYANPPL